ncbi:MAG: radical SAM protein [Desulfuromonadales bacterium]|nr:radical SAM protein [Desulfuromonadales bacterium]
MKNCLDRIYGAEFTPQEIADAVRDGRLLSMEIEFNQSCNFRCIYCYASDTPVRRNELTKDEFLGVIDQARELGARKIIILGGEPMLYPHIMEMIRHIRSKGMDVELFTNGANITPEVARELYANDVRAVLKMNTFDESLQDTLSGCKGAHGQIQEAFENLKQAGYPSADHPLGISSIICQQNIEELPRMWEWLRDQGILPYLEMMTPQGGAREHNMLELDSRTLEQFFQRISDLDRTKYGILWDPQPPLVGGECLRHQFSCAVNSEGLVQSCVGITIPIGDLRTQRLKEILRDSEVVQDLKNYKDLIKGPCRECQQLDSCYGCRGTAFQLTGDYLASDPLCWKNSGRRDEIMFLPVDVSRVIPHKPPMLLIDRLLEIGDRVSVSEMTVRKEMVFVDESGRLDDASYPEIISQAVAAQEGFRRFGSSNPLVEGFLLGVKKLEILGEAHVGDTLRVSLFKASKFGDFGILDGKVYNGATLVARGEIKVWQNNAGVDV